MTMQLTCGFLLSPIVMLNSPIANDNWYGDAEFIAANLATTELTATLAATLAHDDGAP
jgi:hypothetical protein